MSLLSPAVDLMFELTYEPIEPRSTIVPGAGGFVTFEGKVRNRHRGREVVELEYEAYSPMAVSEGQKLIQEAVQKFDLLTAMTIHRLGRLKIGDTAVWIEVGAAHRHEAFLGCEYIIDELKKRVPIWKKEHYLEGDSGWIGCDEPTVGCETDTA